MIILTFLASHLTCQKILQYKAIPGHEMFKVKKDVALGRSHSLFEKKKQLTSLDDDKPHVLYNFPSPCSIPSRRPWGSTLPRAFSNSEPLIDGSYSYSSAL